MGWRLIRIMVTNHEKHKRSRYLKNLIVEHSSSKEENDICLSYSHDNPSLKDFVADKWNVQMYEVQR